MQGMQQNCALDGLNTLFSLGRKTRNPENRAMPKRSNDQNKVAAKQASKVTKTKLPEGEDLLGSDELRKSLTMAKKRIQ
jgi:hypothetical protein